MANETKLTYEGTLVVTTCHCGIALAVPQSLYRKAQSQTNFAIFCPLGHEFVYTKNEADRQRERAEEAEARATARLAALDRERARTKHAENRVRAYKGQLTKVKKRASAGVCPAPGCKRSFQNVARHIASQHPELGHDA